MSNQQISPEEIGVTFKDDKLILFVKGEIVRTVSPIHGKVYTFQIEGEECHFIYQNYEVRGQRIQQMWLYPLNMFKQNLIQL